MIDVNAKTLGEKRVSLIVAERQRIMFMRRNSVEIYLLLERWKRLNSINHFGTRKQ